MTRLLRWLAAHPAAVLGAVILLTLVSALACFDLHSLRPRFHIEASAEALLPEHDADRAVLAEVQHIFGNESPLIVAVRMTPRVFTAANLERVAALDHALAQLIGVRSVYSLADANNPRAVKDDIDVSGFLQQARADPAQIDALMRELQGNPLYHNTLVSADGRDAAFAVTLTDADPNRYLADHMDQRIRAAVAAVLPGATVWITGDVPVRAATERALSRTLLRVVPIVFLLVLTLLLVSFGSLRVALAALLTVAAALLWTLAAAQALGIPLNLVTSIVPPLVVTIGLSYTIHLLSAWSQARQHVPQAGPVQRREWVMQRIGIGLTLSAATTIAGFLSLLLNPLPAIRQFAVLAALGTTIVALLTLVLLPVLLAMAPGACEHQLIGQRRFARWAGRLARFDREHRRGIVVTAVVLAALALWSAGHIRTGTDFIASFDRDAPVRQDFEAINQAFDGANAVQVLVRGNDEGALASPAAARAVDDLERWLRQQPEVGATWSYVDLLKRLNRLLHDDSTKAAVVPDNTAAIRQELLFGGGDALSRLVDAQYRAALITVRIKVDGSARIGDFLQRLDRRLQALPVGLTAQATGSTVLATRAVNVIAGGHLASVLIATGVIWLLLSVMFTSVRAGLLATLPNLVPVAVYFGTLGALGIPLNPTTSLIASIVLGIAVNDTIHFLARFNADARAQGDEGTALESALAAVLRPITLATIALCLGFLAFTGGALHSQAQFGALAAFTLAVAWIADMTLTPALGSRLHIITLWDMLRLDLGANPQHTIPLLTGLSTRQARQFALTAKIETASPGQRVIREGDQARDIYVIVDGEVEVWVERHGQHKPLTTMGRGAVIGEAGYFGQRRTANVDAASEVRLLRFDAQDLERLRKRYPRVAAVVLRNLNRIQAERIAHMTAMVE